MRDDAAWAHQPIDQHGADPAGATAAPRTLADAVIEHHRNHHERHHDKHDHGHRYERERS